MVRRLPCVGFPGIQALPSHWDCGWCGASTQKGVLPKERGEGVPFAQRGKCAPLRALPSAGFRAPEAIVSAILRRWQPNRHFGRTPSADKMRMKA